MRSPKFNPVKKGKNQPFYPEKEHYDAQKWVFRGGYKIYPVPEDITSSFYRICIQIGTKKQMGKQLYSKKEVEDRIWGLYLEIYNKQKLKK